MIIHDHVDRSGKETVSFLSEDKAHVGSAILDYQYHFPDSSEIWIKSFIIYDNFRGKKLSHKMMEEIINHARKSGCKSILLTVKTDNEPAIKCYTKAGFYIKHFNKELNHYEMKYYI